MRWITFLLLSSIVCYQNVLAQSTGKISYTISNGLQLSGVDQTNPVIYDNDWLMDTPEDQFLWLKAHNGEINLVGNINTRDMYGCSSGACLFSLQQTFGDWTNAYAIVTQMGLKNIPAPIAGSTEALVKPASGRIEDTRFNISAGSELIVAEARKASASKPLIVMIGGNPTSVANAYLKDPTIADKMIIMHVDGWASHGQYNATDSWATYVVMKKLKYIIWDGDLNSWYNGKNINITQDMINRLPNNPLANSLKSFLTGEVFSIYHDIGDGPPICYFFNHSLWKNVQRRTENNQPTTSDNYDFLIVSENDWLNYGPLMMDYMTNPANYLLSPNTLPSISLTAPANNASYALGAAVTITATASDANGSVSRVEFYNGNTKIGEDLTSPYSFAWTPGSAGTYSISARATDNENGQATTSAVSINVTNTNTPPVISLTSPANGSSYPTGSTIAIAASASDAGGAISKVEFFNGTTKLGEDLTSPYSYSWINVANGTYTISAKATDNQNAVTSSASVSVTVTAGNTPPVITITAPANNATYTTGASVTVSANASDADGSVTKVECFNGTVKLGEDLTSPYSFIWTNVQAGSYSLTMKATDNQNLSTTSTAINITVSASSTPPVVNLTSPANNTSSPAGSPITLTATATAAAGTITKVEFFNGSTKLGEDLTSPYSYVWTNPPVGTHSLGAKATNNNNLVGNSQLSQVTVFVANVPPVVALTSPANNATFPTNSAITLTATASDSDGPVSKVEFFSGTTKLGEDLTSPYSFVWKNVPDGNYSLSAKATDSKNAVVTSSSVSIAVGTSPSPPLITITSPVNNAIFFENTTITFDAVASTPIGSIKKVEFFNGITKLGEDLASPFSFTWNNVAPGSFVITATATDNLGLSSTAEVSITVNAVNNPPQANAGEDITTPLPVSKLTLVGSGTDTDGTILHYQWSQVSGPDGVSLVQESDGKLHLSNLEEGSYIFNLTVKDDKNLTGTDEVIVKIIPEISTLETLPRYFSPNGDGINDYWEWPQVELFANSQLIILNRFGQPVYESRSYQNNWNGTVDGNPLQEDAYYYIIKLNNTDIKGAVRIIR
jgi:gliding motility-associated-like protein